MDAGSCKVVMLLCLSLILLVTLEDKYQKQTVNKELFLRVLVELPLFPIMETKGGQMTSNTT